MSITDISRELNLNRNSVAKYVNMLLVAGQAEMKTHAAAKVYYLSQRVPLSAMLDFSTDAIIIINSDLSVLQVNDNFLTLSGISRDNIEGKFLKAIEFPVFQHEEILTAITDSIKGISRENTLTWNNPEGTLFLQVKLIPTVLEDGSAALTILFENVTRQILAQRALEKSETLYRAIVEDQTDLICRFGPDCMITFANQACMRFIRFSGKEGILRNFFDFFPVADQGCIRKALEMLSSEYPTQTAENRIIGPDNSLLWMQWGIRALFTPDGKISEYQVVGRDITELRESAEEIQQLLRKKESLLTEIKYRTRSNLHFMASLIDLQSLSRTDSACFEVLREEKNQIMALARIYEESTQSDNLSEIPVLHYLQKLGNDIYDAYHISSDRISLDFETDDATLDINTAIPLGLIFNELLSNACKHAFPENRSGHIRCVIRQDKDRITFSVTDDGIGLPENFDPTHISTVGLELVSTLCQQIHGTITYTGGHGTSISIIFPYPANRA